MPQRTNDFQELVSLVQKTLAPKGATVTDSAMVAVEGLGVLREVDILIESDVGPYRMKIAVEAKDHKRKLDNTDIDEILGKYRGAAGVRVNKIVVVARRGFAKTAVKRAKLEDVELLTLAEAKGSNVTKLLNKAAATAGSAAGPAPRRSVSAFNLRLVGVEMRPPPPVPDPAALARGVLICKCCGRSYGGVRRHANHLLHRHVWPHAEFQRRALEAGRQHPAGEVCARIDYPVPKLVFRLDGVDHPLTHLALHAHGQFREAVTTARTFDLTDAEGRIRSSLLHLRQEVDGKGMTLVIPQGDHPPEKVTVKFDAGFLKGIACFPARADRGRAGP